RMRARLSALSDEKAAQGLRSLAIAWRDFPTDRNRPIPEDERDLVFAGYCIFEDSPKTSAAGAIARLEAKGVRVKIISGDAAPIVRHLLGALAVPAHGILSGSESAEISETALAAK